MHAFWELIVSNALISTVMAVGAAILSRWWRNPAAIHLLWVFVLLKLFSPPLFTAELSIPNDWRIANERVELSKANSPAFAASEDVARTALTATASRSNTNPSAASNLQPLAQDQSLSNFATDPRNWSLSSLLITIWISGSIGVSTWFAIRIRRFATLLNGMEPASDDVLSLAQRLGNQLGLRRIPNVWMTSSAVPPLVWSIGGRPKIVLPSELVARLSCEAQSAILAHELAHVRRRDYLVRFLELAAATLFWWHPVVWWACSQLRELEEQCCDSRVLDLVPRQARSYAAALVDTLEFLSERPRVVVPLPTAAYSNGSLTRRIVMLTQPRTNRLNVRSGALIVALVALPLAFVFAESQPSNDLAAKAPATAIHGRVTDETGAPLADALVRVAIPATDMRFIDSGSRHKLLETRTDASGGYRIELPDIKHPTPVSIDAMVPGQRRLVGTLYSGGDPRRVEAKPGETAEASMTLIPALYFKGVVVDEHGQPIPAVEVAANANTDVSSSGVERTASRPDGSFELFNYAPQPLSLREAISKGVVYFFHPDYVKNQIDDIYSLEPDQRDKLRIVLAAGQQISGTVLDTAGKPVPGVMVKVTSAQGGHRKATKTDSQGKFTLRGLVAGPNTIEVHALELGQKAVLQVALDSGKHDVDVQLQAIDLPAKPPTVEVLGMQLTDITPQLRAAYDLYNERGALILDPGPDHDRLGIGTLAKGYDFWMVGEQRVGSVREFIEQILAEAAKQNAHNFSIRVVYNFKSLEMDGSNTQYLELTKDDLQQLQAALAQLSSE